MQVDVDPALPWQAELLGRALPDGATRLALDEDEVALVAIGAMVERVLEGGWASLGPLWRPALQRDIAMLAAAQGAHAVTEETLRVVLPPQKPPSRLLPYLRVLADEAGGRIEQVRFLPAEHEARFLAIAEATIPGGWCGWGPERRAAFVAMLGRLLRDVEPEAIPADWIRVVVGAVERRDGARLAS